MVGPFSASVLGEKEREGKRERHVEKKESHGVRASSCTGLRTGLRPEERQEQVEAFLFPGDIYLGAGGHRGPRFA